MSRRHSGWEALGEAVAPGARVTRLRRLAGGAGGTDAYDVTLDRGPRRVVVKLYPDDDSKASSEWGRLEFAQRVTAPVPEPVAADLESAWFGRPAVVMSRLPGRPDVSPKDADSWVAALALALTQIHETVLDGAALTPPPPAETWDPPAGEHDRLTTAAVSAVKARLPHSPPNTSSRMGTSIRATFSGIAAVSVASSTGAQQDSALDGLSSRTAEPTCVSSSALMPPIGWPTHTRTSSGRPPGTLPCTTSSGCSTSGTTPAWPSTRTENKATYPTGNCHSHTSMSNCGEY